MSKAGGNGTFHRDRRRLHSHDSSVPATSLLSSLPVRAITFASGHYAYFWISQQDVHAPSAILLIFLSYTWLLQSFLPRIFFLWIGHFHSSPLLYWVLGYLYVRIVFGNGLDVDPIEYLHR